MKRRCSRRAWWRRARRARKSSTSSRRGSRSRSRPTSRRSRCATAPARRPSCALASAAPGVPVIAEEEVAAGRIPVHGQTYFLVDPLDGTKEFVRGGDDYTVNIGLIVDRAPRLGVVYQPALDRLHLGLVGAGAW